MSFQTLIPTIRQANGASLKKAREQLDRIAEQERFGWKQVQGLAMERFGKRDGLSIGQCRELIVEIRKRVR